MCEMCEMRVKRRDVRVDLTTFRYFVHGHLYRLHGRTLMDSEEAKCPRHYSGVAFVYTLFFLLNIMYSLSASRARFPYSKPLPPSAAKYRFFRTDAVT